MFMQQAYQESPAQAQTRMKAFTYHAPTEAQVNRYGSIRAEANSLALHLNQQCPPSRELSLAMTKLEEAVFWANAAIARGES